MAIMRITAIRLWVTRLLIFVVLVWNLQAALTFLFYPRNYATQFSLSGVSGEILILSIGILFVMWNIPYVVALWNPVRNRLSLWESIAMQGIGLLGESYLLIRLGNAHPFTQSTITRFIFFDSIGLISLICVAWIGRTPLDSEM